MSQPLFSSNKQIRPKIRDRTPKASASSTKGTHSPTVTDGGDVEDARKRIESWMGLKESSVGESTGEARSQGVVGVTSQSLCSDVSSRIESKESSSEKTEKPATRSILKTPKYTKHHLNEASGQGRDPNEEEKMIKQDVPEDAAAVPAESGFVCKDFVVERDPTKPMRKRKVKPRQQQDASSHSIVEGYVPRIATGLSPSNSSEIVVPDSQGSNSVHMARPDPGTPNSSDVDVQASVITPTDDPTTQLENENPLILNSLEELFEAAGDLNMTLPEDRHKITEDTKLVEADIAFSVMTQEQYDGKLAELREQHEQERQAQLRVFMGSEDIFHEPESEDDGDEESDEEDDEDMMEILMAGNEISEEDYYQDRPTVDEDDEVRQPRVFRLLWDTLAEWFTPEAAQYLSHLLVTTSDDTYAPSAPWKSPAIQRSDIEASRCAGLMAMVKLYLPNILEELGFAQELRRTADVRLGELIRSFNYVLEAPKLPVKLWKAMTCILLEIVLVEAHKGEMLTIPTSAAVVGMTLEEYRYLSRSAVKNFGVEGP